MVGPASVVVVVVVEVAVVEALAGQYHSMSVTSPHSSEISTAHTGARSFSKHRIALCGSGTSTQLVQLVGVPLLHSMAVSWSAWTAALLSRTGVTSTLNPVCMSTVRVSPSSRRLRVRELTIFSYLIVGKCAAQEL